MIPTSIQYVNACMRGKMANLEDVIYVQEITYFEYCRNHKLDMYKHKTSLIFILALAFEVSSLVFFYICVLNQIQYKSEPLHCRLVYTYIPPGYTTQVNNFCCTILVISKMYMYVIPRQQNA